MKKFAVITVSIIVAIGLIFGVKSIFFKPDDITVEITQEQIENRILTNKITNAINEEYLTDTFSGDDAKEQIEKSHKPTEYDDVVDELTRAAVIKSILTSENCDLSEDSIKETVDKEYETIKTDESSSRYYECINKVLPKFNISEEEYVNLLYDYSYDLYNKPNFNQWFLTSKHYKDDSDISDSEQIEAYLSKKLKKATVEIK